MSFRNILREYFTFNRRERNGVFVLLSIIVLLLVYLSVSPRFYTPVNADFSRFEKEVAAFEAEQRRMGDSVADEREMYYAESRTTYDHKKERIRKESANQYNKNDLFPVYTKYIPKKTEPLNIELNAADTTELKKLKGIGSSFARRIVKYRDRLGGYVEKEQLMEVYGFDAEKYELVSPFLTIDLAKSKKININTSTPEEMKSHPYIRWKLAGIIAAYRKNHGPFSSVDDIRKIDLVTDSLFTKIAPYLKAE